ncbi:MAG: cyclic pyranopterin phosphate synthase [Chloroflexi bacterium]|jgi:cyclic pyranopterin phosphate synthase|nr:MAG: cyclic pyranopterin phosphate synthase [Chloroflexota bacterium]
MIINDSLQRPLRDLRISVTDKCNFRCTYCMPKETYNKDYKFLAKNEILDFEEIYRIAKIFHGLGIEKIRITGGEPLLRNDLSKLLGLLNQIPNLDLAMTTNGILLNKYAIDLKNAGLSRVTVSLDGIDDSIFRAVSDTNYSYRDVLSGIDAAINANMKVKVNMVIKKNINEDHVFKMIDHFKHSGIVLRFIEFMDVGSTNHWSKDAVVPSLDLQRKIHSKYPLKSIIKNYNGEVANRFELLDNSLELGFISSVTQPFCSECTRIRLSSDGKLFTCLFSLSGFDIKNQLRSGIDDNELTELISNIWQKRDDRYSEIRNQIGFQKKKNKVEMPYIGG